MLVRMCWWIIRHTDTHCVCCSHTLWDVSDTNFHQQAFQPQMHQAFLIIPRAVPRFERAWGSLNPGILLQRGWSRIRENKGWYSSLRSLAAWAQKQWEAQVQPRETIPSHLDVEWNLSAPQTLQDPTSGTMRISLSARHMLPVRDSKAARARGHSPSELRLLRLVTTTRKKFHFGFFWSRSLPDTFTLGFSHYQNSFFPTNPLSEGIYRNYNPPPDGIYIRLTIVEAVLIRGI